MNWIAELKEFDDWVETNQPPKAAISLWYALMQVANRRLWPRTFTTPISALESKTGFKRSELCEARNYLLQKGRIYWKSFGGNLAAEYEIVSFTVRIADTNLPQTEKLRPYSGHKRGHKPSTSADTNLPQTGTINKTETKTQTETKTSVPIGTGAADAGTEGDRGLNANDSPEQPKEERKKGSAQKKKEDATPHWQALVSEWFRFYAQMFNGAEPSFTHSPEAREALRMLIAKLKHRIETHPSTAGQEWTEGLAVDWFRKFLIKAWEENWMRQNFLLKNLNTSFDAIKDRKPGQKSAIGGGNNAAAIIPADRDYGSAKL